MIKKPPLWSSVIRNKYRCGELELVLESNFGVIVGCLGEEPCLDILFLQCQKVNLILQWQTMLTQTEDGWWHGNIFGLPSK